MWILVCGIYIYGMMYGGPPHIVNLPRGCMAGRACRPPRALTLSLRIPAISWSRATHRDSYPLSQSLCMCALCVPLSITTAKGQATAVDTSTLLPSAHRLSLSALDLLQSLRLFFQTRLLRIGGERERGQAPERRGMEGWRKNENREGGSEGSFVTSKSCILVLL